MNGRKSAKRYLLKSGHKLKVPSLLFEKIEDDAIEKQLEKLQKSKELNLPKNTVMDPQKENITYEDFARMDIRIGTIIEAEKVAKTKKLMKLLIDTGIDKRTVVSGIAEFFEPEQIVGKQVTLLANLESRNLKGIDSQGMILMSEDADGSLKFVVPEVKVNPGSKVS